MNFLKKPLLFICLACFMYAADVPDDSSYVIEAKGDFGKELKALVEKYAKDENVSINVYKKSPQDSSGGFINIGVDKNRAYNASRGEELYNVNCKHCHGDKGTSRAMGASQRLADMSAEDISVAMSGYNSDPTFGGKLKYIMQPMAKNVNFSQVGDIIAYIKGNNAFSSEDDIKNSNISTKPAQQGSYLE
ncbi:c-type cytochrome [Campylobacter fetus]|uniref:Cytochrome C n=1 Tax=Campylobacter fetus subsp. testudinum TaxID=1507806 RepID=A0AAX0HBK4_CAMFE|nr:cytochrome c [Campylobacter fetus]AGZ81294.1 cytochrome c [Campylobacter fetus subsp. testudinum 03-427]AJB45047.1 cytochrome C [Campylobacter fetus subsp. testudinum]EAI4321693.1 c-type cytochrome [Campylobacter fetus]EAI4391547.1 c-type cytochrome [Campylobacter fetus]EAK0826771.1 c-type cytochrome [Campylobacter fetus]